MPRIFHRTLAFDVEGEIYDSDTSPEDILKNYDFRFKDYDDRGDRCFMSLEHKDHRGKITKVGHNPKISKSKIKDTEYFVI
jgi:major membrane immunogen (membrane-anchored lipoprotein)